MYYYLTTYSFDDEKSLHGPFSSYEAAWEAVSEAADEEYRIDTEENGYDTQIDKQYDEGKIVLLNRFDDQDDKTEWFIVDAPCTFLEGALQNAKKVLVQNGVPMEKASDVLLQLKEVLFGTQIPLILDQKN